MNQLAGKVVAITGGGTGIGAGIAKSWLKRDARSPLAVDVWNHFRPFQTR